MVNVKRRRSNWSVNFFTGLSDGLIIPFALIAGYSRIAAFSSELVDFIIIVIPVAAILMAIGGYFTTKDQVYEQTASLNKRSSDIRKFYANIGFNPELQEQASEEHFQEKLQWEQMASTSQPLQSPVASAITIFIAYCIGGLLSLSPYFLYEDPMNTLKISAAITIPLLFVSGYIKNRITGANPWLGGGQLVLFGVLASLAAFGVAHLLK